MFYGFLNILIDLFRNLKPILFEIKMRKHTSLKLLTRSDSRNSSMTSIRSPILQTPLVSSEGAAQDVEEILRVLDEPPASVLLV
jgi:hypothetical protein